MTTASHSQATESREELSPKRRRIPQTTRQLLWTAPAFAYLLVFFGYPIIVLLDTSFREVSLGTAVRGDRPWVGLDNFREVLSSSEFAAAWPRTAIFVVTVVVFELILGVVLALALQERLPGVSLARSLVFFVWLLPPVVSGTVWRYILGGTKEGLLNHVLLGTGIVDSPVVFLADPTIALIIVTGLTLWAGIPFVTLICLAAIQAVSQDLHEAAQIDGAGPFRRFTVVTLPAIAPTLWMLAILQAVFVFKTFDVILIMTGGGPGTSTATLPYLAYVNAFANNDFGVSGAYGVLGMGVAVAIAVPYLLLLRRREAE